MKARWQNPTLVVVDDDPSNLDALSTIFKKENYNVVRARSGKEALDVVREEPVDVILTDLMMPGMSGLELLKSAKAISPVVEVVLMTAFGTVERAVEAMKQGAYDFVTKPFKRIQIVKSVRRAMEKQTLLTENRDLRAQIENLKQSSSDIVGNSLATRKLLDMVKQVAPSSATVLIQGESGTGKELVAREIHRLSDRADKPLVPFNCAALPQELAEGELFGHEKGAYTGAHKARAGLFRDAHGGTLFLDEVAELDLSTQGKLLRVIQEREVKPLGGSTPIPVDVRLIAASKEGLESAVANGAFREDLFYRLNVITVAVSPLRERKDDISLLSGYFLRKMAKKNGKEMDAISTEAMDALYSHDWPGNVRELENIIERAVVLSRGSVLESSVLPWTSDKEQVQDVVTPITIPMGKTLEEIEILVLRTILDRVEGDKKLAADILGISQRTVYRMLDRNTSSI